MTGGVSDGLPLTMVYARAVVSSRLGIRAVPATGRRPLVVHGAQDALLALRPPTGPVADGQR